MNGQFIAYTIGLVGEIFFLRTTVIEDLKRVYVGLYTCLRVPGVMMRPTIARNGMQSIDDRATPQPIRFAQSGYSYVSYFSGSYQTNPKTMIHCVQKRKHHFNNPI